jgi:hypothetical protein
MTGCCVWSVVLGWIVWGCWVWVRESDDWLLCDCVICGIGLDHVRLVKLSEREWWLVVVCDLWYWAGSCELVRLSERDWWLVFVCYCVMCVFGLDIVSWWDWVRESDDCLLCVIYGIGLDHVSWWDWVRESDDCWLCVICGIGLDHVSWWDWVRESDDFWLCVICGIGLDHVSWWDWPWIKKLE